MDVFIKKDNYNILEQKTLTFLHYDKNILSQDSTLITHFVRPTLIEL